MASYHEWNNAIVNYFLQGLPTGATVYLSLGSVALFEIGSSFNIEVAGKEPWVDDYLTALRTQCIRGGKVQLPTIKGLNQSGIPHGVAFLAAMVLATYHMVEEETEEGMISEANYFKRLRNVLGLGNDESGRPLGLNPPGIEESLWKSWNNFLLEKGFFPSAEAGQGAHKYISYPLSQALLRNADKERLERIFRKEEKSGRIVRTLDLNRLNIWLKNNSHLITSSHLKGLFNQNDLPRVYALSEEVYDVFRQIEWDKEMIDYNSNVSLERQRRLTAGLYRVEDPFTGSLEYLLYPQELRRYKASGLKMIYEGLEYELNQERAGWFYPLWPICPSGGVSYSVKGDPWIQELNVPEKGFWILVRDPANPDSGVFASWGYPELGETFLLLCLKEYCEQIELLAQENLMKWDHAVELKEQFDGWVEYRECMVVSQNWDGIIPGKPDIFHALIPSVRASISLKNGLRLPPHLRWLDGYGPEMTIVAFSDSVKLQLFVLKGSSEHIIKDELVETNRPLSLRELPPGSYVIKAFEASRPVAIKTFRILSWSDLEVQSIENTMGFDLGDYTLEGAMIRSNC